MFGPGDLRSPLTPITARPGSLRDEATPTWDRDNGRRGFSRCFRASRSVAPASVWSSHRPAGSQRRSTTFRAGSVGSTSTFLAHGIRGVLEKLTAPGGLRRRHRRGELPRLYEEQLPLPVSCRPCKRGGRKRVISSWRFSCITNWPWRIRKASSSALLRSAVSTHLAALQCRTSDAIELSFAKLGFLS